MKKLLTLAGLLLAILLTPQIASADPGDPIIRGNLAVSVIGQGKVTGTSIDCPGDCTASDSWRDLEIPPKNPLTAVENSAGWTFTGWEGDGCVVHPINRFKCEGFYSEEFEPVAIARFSDTEVPWVALGPLVKKVVKDTIFAGVTGSDNDRVSRMQCLIDGQPLVDITTGPWPRDLDIRTVPEGEHTMQAKAFDPSGNSTVTPAQTFVVDRVPPVIEFNSPDAVTRAESPSFLWSPVSPDFDSAICNIIEKGAGGHLFPCDPDEPWSQQIPTEGDWTFWVGASDKAGNYKEYTHDFVVDRTAPEVAITSGPADGSTVEKGDVSYSWTVNDRSAVGQNCSWDGGQPTDCDLTAKRSLPKGDHTFQLEVTDQAGNVSSLGRTLKVLSDGTPVDPDPNDPDPNADKTPPVISLSSSKQKLKALKKGLKVKVRCSEACAGKLVAKATRATKVTKAIKFKGRVQMSSAGTSVVKLKPTVRTRKKLKKLTKSKQPLKLTVRAGLADRSGNTASTTLKARVRK